MNLLNRVNLRHAIPHILIDNSSPPQLFRSCHVKLFVQYVYCGFSAPKIVKPFVFRAVLLARIKRQDCSWCD
jgi:hypothetical protein